MININFHKPKLENENKTIVKYIKKKILNTF